MFSRRELFLAGTGLLAGRAAERRGKAGLLVRRPRGSRHPVFVGVPPGTRFDRGALDGIGARFLFPCEDFAQAHPMLRLDLEPRHARIALPGTEVACRVRMPSGPAGFAAAWALPALGIGNVIAYDLDDLATIMRPSAEFHNLEDTGGPLRLPRSLRSCSGVFMTWFGEGLSLSRLSEIVGCITASLPASADFLFAMAERSAWSPRVLLTVFDALEVPERR